MTISNIDPTFPRAIETISDMIHILDSIRVMVQPHLFPIYRPEAIIMEKQDRRLRLRSID
ncbi:MAG TPA: hypothetical protein VFJ51_06920 [Nitrososphaeraceae archaeon]|nr:hypothetical protein [Nitrososphaeraceae archaeon]